jgi:hypothetical protein
MVTKRRVKLREEPEDTIAFHDLETNKVEFVTREKLKDRLRKIYAIIADTLPDIENIGKYQLEEIGISVSVSGQILVLTVQGGITLTYRVSRSS